MEYVIFNTMKKKNSVLNHVIMILLFTVAFACFSVSMAVAPDANNKQEQFSFIWISDTQTLTEKPSLAEKIPDLFGWIVHSRADYNTVGIFHTGDIVENGWNQRYWDAINAGIDLIPDDLPFIAAAGNHDVAKKRISYEPWLEQNFVKKQNPDQQYNNGEGYYHLFYQGNEKFIAVSMGYNSVDEDGIDWMRSVFNRYSDHTGILIVHSFLSYINGKDSLFTKHGQKLFEQVVKPCENVKLVLSGHIKGSDRYSVSLEDASGKMRNVNMLRYNCQYASYADLIGYIRILRFDPENRSIEVMSYSPIQDNSHYRFELPENEYFLIENAF